MIGRPKLENQVWINAILGGPVSLPAQLLVQMPLTQTLGQCEGQEHDYHPGMRTSVYENTEKYSVMFYAHRSDASLLWLSMPEEGIRTSVYSFAR